MSQKSYLVGSTDGRGGEGLQGGHGEGGPADHGLEQGPVVQAGLALPADACHHLHCLPHTQLLFRLCRPASGARVWS